MSSHHFHASMGNMRNVLSCTNKACKLKGEYDFNDRNQQCRHSIMTPMQHQAHESFIIQPHCNGNSMMHSQCGIPNDCYLNSQSKMHSIENCPYLHGPTIEDRLINTENLIKEMNAKFEDITSTKNSAKHELNKLVKTLTMTSDQNNKWMVNKSDSESDDHENGRIQLINVNENMLSSDDEQSDDNSSFDEET